MRKLVFGINATADGYCDHHLGLPDDEMVRYFAQLMRESDTLLYGRKTYELMFPYWPEIAKARSGKSPADNDFAQAFVGVQKLVIVSKTLSLPDSESVRVIRDNLESEILKLKNEVGRNISTGGVTLPSQLLQFGLIDDFHLVIHPTIAGKGRRLFESTDFEKQINLELVTSRVFDSGIIALQYSKR